jgi:ketosteroid isomerase-like protein
MEPPGFRPYLPDVARGCGNAKEDGMQDPVEIVKQCYAEFGRGNVEGVLGLLHEDALWVDPGYPHIPYAGKRKGKAEIADFFGQMAGHIQFTRFEPQAFFRDGNIVAVRGYFAGKGIRTGKTCETEWVMIWKVEAGKVREYQAYIDTQNVSQALN